MAAYRLFCMDGAGRIQFAEVLEADNDEEAIRKARELKRHAIKCEIWFNARLIAVLNADDLAK